MTDEEIKTVMAPTTPQMKMRQSNIELLRILCMFFIIVHHSIVHGSMVFAQLSLLNRIAVVVLVPAGKIGFVCFIAISMWFFVDSTFKGRRFVLAWLEVLFYTAVMAMASWYFGADMGLSDWIASLLPIGGNSHGFAATYLVFLLFLPFILKATVGMTRRQTLWGIGALVYVQVIAIIFSRLGILNLGLHPFPSEIILFVMCFFILYYLKHWPLPFQKKKNILVVLLVAIWAIVSIGLYCMYSGVASHVMGYLSVLFKDENSVLFIIAGILLFLLFMNIHIADNKIINLVASTTFGILLLHDHNIFRPILWDTILDMPNIWLGSRPILWAFAISAGLFSGGFIIDLLRKRLLENPISKTTIFARIVAGLDSVFIENDDQNKKSLSSKQIEKKDLVST